MSRRSVSDQASGLIRSLSRATAHYLFPNDIDYYFLAFELVDADDKTVQYFAFPVNSKSIIFQDTEITKIQRTIGGITTLKTTTFDPKVYTLQGDFGRNFKVIVNGSPFTFSALNFDLSSLGFDLSNLRIGVPSLSVEVKSGYGCIKILERIIKNAKQLDDSGRPYKLYFYNTSLNHQYLVEPQDFTFSQNLQTNMIWQYNLRLNAIARLEDLGGAKKYVANALAVSNLNKIAGGLTRKLDKVLSGVV